MKAGKVISSGIVSIPATGYRAREIITDVPYGVGGEFANETGLYVDADCPEPETGDPITWGSHTAIVGGKPWRKHEVEFNPSDQ